MHLIEFENFQVVPSAETLFIKSIRDYYNKDKTKNKEKYMEAMSIIYFYADPRSTYSYITDDNERLAEILKQEGIKDFKMTKEFQKMIDDYKPHTITTSYLILQDSKQAADNLRKVLRSINYEDASDLDEKAKVAKTVASILSMLPKLAKDLVEAEKIVAAEIDEQTKARGNRDKAILDDGILNFMNQ
jgi:hypothetical protein